MISLFNHDQLDLYRGIAVIVIWSWVDWWCNEC